MLGIPHYCLLETGKNISKQDIKFVADTTVFDLYLNQITFKQVIIQKRCDKSSTAAQ